ncbi:DUF4440 domain-containing protein [Pedobacter sp. HMF7647]|uniref:DUF4440 domain-containing protein n=1 Tax=Hufsiella arboris TaxID=2695275 RepID=A0A7K1Y463_9SPHI|nr:DUF4440 domain-containing protein [Hufsiella arboris]MXV49375.1 DUF4440 domain-containing protein [Hufsiella arboris]
MKLTIFLAAGLFFVNSLFAQDNQKEIKDVLEAQRQAWNRGDIVHYMDGYWQSDSLVFIGRSGPHYGWSNTLENYKKSYPDKAAMGLLTFDVKEIRLLDTANAFVIGAWHLKRSKDEPHGYFTLLFRKTKQGWKIIADHSSSS